LPFPLNVYFVAVATALLTTLCSLPLWSKWCFRVGLMDEPGNRKIHQHPIPLAGGLAVMTGLVLPLIAAAVLLFGPFTIVQGDWTTLPREAAAARASNAGVTTTGASLLQYGLSRRAVPLVGIILGAAGILLLGFLDDKYELPPKKKFIGQLLIALLVTATGVRITLFVNSAIFHYAITILWIITLINAFNFMDNMNGLCAGLGAIAAWYFGLIAASGGQYLVALIAFLSFGALLGFLPFNFPRARAFLGDAGSHLIGYLLAVLAILPHFYTPRHPRRWAVLVPLFLLAVPLIDLSWIVFFRWRIGQPFYQGDRNHLSHRLVRLGLSPKRAVLVLWLLSALLGGAAFLIAR